MLPCGLVEMYPSFGSQCLQNLCKNVLQTLLKFPANFTAKQSTVGQAALIIGVNIPNLAETDSMEQSFSTKAQRRPDGQRNPLFL
jgi:hypothetical protein